MKRSIFSLYRWKIVSNTKRAFFYADRSGTEESYTEKDQFLDGAVELYKDEEEKKLTAGKVKKEADKKIEDDDSWESRSERLRPRVV